MGKHLDFGKGLPCQMADLHQAKVDRSRIVPSGGGLTAADDVAQGRWFCCLCPLLRPVHLAIHLLCFRTKQAAGETINGRSDLFML